MKKIMLSLALAGCMAGAASAAETREDRIRSATITLDYVAGQCDHLMMPSLINNILSLNMRDDYNKVSQRELIRLSQQNYAFIKGRLDHAKGDFPNLNAATCLDTIEDAFNELKKASTQ